MYVCICNALRKSQITAAAQNGAATVEAAYAACDAKIQCGHCQDEAHDVITEARQSGPQSCALQAAE
ncbi:MAG: (2Fe-2S)-binding protein [Rhodospirillaceae bacterium]|nr:(2Fe-2S)-binding protein [Rhodospirillaceae bacterium]